METQGKFILMDADEFRRFLINAVVTTRITRVQNHHTFIPSYRNFNGANHFEKMKAMEADHISRNFGGIAQHITTFPDGKIGLGRNLNIKPTCIHLGNSGGICIENLGNFDTGHDQMSAEQRETIIKVNALLCFKFNLTPGIQTIVYHHWFRLSDGFRDGGKADDDHKTCPGTGFFEGNSETSFTSNLLPLIVADLSSIGININNPVPSAQIGVVQARILNVRTGPGKTFPVISKLKENETVSILETNGEWDRIGQGKWVNANFVAIQ
jgi:hypothetical protein